MILSPEIDKNALDYYRNLYDEIYLVTCSKCKTVLAIEIMGEVSGYPRDSRGLTTLSLDSKHLATRVRTDGVVGYQCACGNDTRGNEIEEKLSPKGTFLPHELDAIHKEYHETFIRERI